MPVQGTSVIRTYLTTFAELWPPGDAADLGSDCADRLPSKGGKGGRGVEDAAAQEYSEQVHEAPVPRALQGPFQCGKRAFYQYWKADVGGEVGQRWLRG